MNEEWCVQLKQWCCRFLIDVEKRRETPVTIRGAIQRWKRLRGIFNIYLARKMWCRQSCWQYKCCWQQKEPNKIILPLLFSWFKKCWDDTAESSCSAECNITVPHPSYFAIWYLSPGSLGWIYSINSQSSPVTNTVFLFCVQHVHSFYKFFVLFFFVWCSSLVSIDLNTSSLDSVVKCRIILSEMSMWRKTKAPGKARGGFGSRHHWFIHSFSHVKYFNEDH